MGLCLVVDSRIVLVSNYCGYDWYRDVVFRMFWFSVGYFDSVWFGYRFGIVYGLVV